jgi:hypothetical protein
MLYTVVTLQRPLRRSCQIYVEQPCGPGHGASNVAGEAEAAPLSPALRMGATACNAGAEFVTES